MPILNLYRQKKLILDRALIAIWIISLTILSFSIYHQYIEKIELCTLCKWQRLVYFLIFAISPIGLISRLNLSIRANLNVIILIGFCLAIYHTAVQFGWLSDRCIMTQKIENLNDFMQMIEQPKVSCSAIGWKLFGLSASIYNAILSLIALTFLYFSRQPSSSRGEINA